MLHLFRKKMLWVTTQHLSFKLTKSTTYFLVCCLLWHLLDFACQSDVHRVVQQSSTEWPAAGPHSPLIQTCCSFRVAYKIFLISSLYCVSLPTLSQHVPFSVMTPFIFSSRRPKYFFNLYLNVTFKTDGIIHPHCDLINDTTLTNVAECCWFCTGILFKQ